MWRIVIVIAVIFFVIWYFRFDKHYPRLGELRTDNQFWGITFSTKQADRLNLPWAEVYQATIDDLQVKKIRLPIYWDEIEIGEGEYDFAKFDIIFNEGAKREVKFLAAIGWRLPRWPECHTPQWLADSEVATQKERTLEMLKVVVERYRNRPEIIAWQVENEPLVDWFGICPPADQKFLEQEIALVKSLDDRPILLTVSGELSMWSREAKLADQLGSSLYRVAWNKAFGYWRWFLPSKFYQWKANRVGKTDKVVISELQAEPWSPTGRLLDFPQSESEKSFALDQFRANVQLAQNIDFQASYLWGIEWWYLQKQAGNSSYWDFAKTLFVK